MRFRITQRVIAGSEMVWVVWDTEDHKIVASGSYVSCSNACRELNDSTPPKRLSQTKIDGDGAHRRGFLFHLSQIRNAVFPSTQSVVE
jgi:hypothetical protein